MSVQNKNLSQSLSQDGYAVAKSVLPSDLLDTLRQQRDYVLAGLSQAHCEAYQSQGGLVNLGDYPEFSHLIGSAVLQKLIQGLGPASCCWLAGYLISKPPRSPALFWHQDWWGWDHPLSYTSRLLGLGVMIYLSDTRRETAVCESFPALIVASTDCMPCRWHTRSLCHTLKTRTTLLINLMNRKSRSK